MKVEKFTELTDEIIAIKLRTDASFLGEIIDRYEGKLTRFIKSNSNTSSEDIKDILQNVFLKVYKNIYDFDETLSFSSWIYRIARNEAIDWYRKEKRKPRLSLEANEVILNYIIADNLIEEEIIKSETTKYFKEIIDSLPDKYKDIVLLRYFEDKSYEEISDILSIPQGTVAIRINRVKNILREKFKSYER